MQAKNEVIETMEWLSLKRPGRHLSPDAVNFIMRHWKPSEGFYTKHQLRYIAGETYPFTQHEKNQILKLYKSDGLNLNDISNPAVREVLRLISAVKTYDFLVADGIININNKIIIELIDYIELMARVLAAGRIEKQEELLRLLEDIRRLESFFRQLLINLPQNQKNLQDVLQRQESNLAYLAALVIALQNITPEYRRAVISALAQSLQENLKNTALGIIIKDRHNEFYSLFATNINDLLLEALLQEAKKGTVNFEAEGDALAENYLEVAIDNLSYEKVNELLTTAYLDAIGEFSEELSQTVTKEFVEDEIKNNRDVILDSIRKLKVDVNLSEDKVFEGSDITREGKKEEHKEELEEHVTKESLIENESTKFIMIVAKEINSVELEQQKVKDEFEKKINANEQNINAVGVKSDEESEELFSSRRRRNKSSEAQSSPSVLPLFQSQRDSSREVRKSENESNLSPDPKNKGPRNTK